MLELTGVTKRIGGRQVLAGIDLTVRPGETVALLGGNGCGKTTTLGCIVGLAAPDGGRVTVDGVDALARGREARERLAFLPQKPSFPATLTVREVVQVAARLRGAAPRSVDREIERCGLSHLANRAVAELSGAERQRVGLAVTFVADVPVYLFDEPTASLDPLATRMLVARARELAADGRAVLFTTHVAADIDRLATRAVVLARGRIVDVPADSDEVSLVLTLPRAQAPLVLGHLEAGGLSVAAIGTSSVAARALGRLDERDVEANTSADSDRVADPAGSGVWARFARPAADPAGSR